MMIKATFQYVSPYQGQVNQFCIQTDAFFL